MEHKAEVIADPNLHAHGITHPEPHVEHALRAQFIEQHQIDIAGVDAVAFSVICCGDPATAERHTVHLPEAITAEDMRTIMFHHAKKHAEAHAKALAAVEIVKALAAEGVECKTCK